MATTRVDWLNDGTIPQTKSSGNWTPADFNAGKIRFTLTFAAASTGSPWRPTSPTYWAVLTTNESNGSALWLEYFPSTGVHTLIFVASDGTTFLGSRALTWTASDDVTITIDQSSATAGASTMAVAGAATGDGTTAGWTRESVFSGSELRFGGWAASSTFNLPAGSVTTSDIDDGNDAVVRTAAGVTALGAATVATRALARSAAGVSALGAAVAAARELARQAAGITAIGVATAADVAGEIVRTAAGVTGIGVATAAARSLARQAAGATALGAATEASRALSRTAGGVTAIGAATAATVAGDAMALGGYGAARVLYGTAAGTVSVTITTEASGSTFLLAVGGNLSDLATPPTDSEGNTWTEVGSFEFTQWPGYGCVYYQAVNGLGAGGSHTFSQQFGQTLGFDECTIAVVEIENAIHVEDFALGESASGSTVNTPSVTSQDACEWIVFSTGDAPTGSTAAYSPSNGLTVIHDTTGVDHPNGYVPIILLHASKASAGTYTSAIGITPAQRLGLGVFAVQAANVIVRQAAGTTALGAATAASRVLNRQAAGVSALGVATAAGRGSTRTAAGETALGAATAATRAVQRTAAGATAISAATAAARALVRSAPGSTALGVATTAARSLARTGAGTTAIGVATAALRALQRTAAGASAIDVATAATHEPAGTHIRSAAGVTGIGVATAAARTVARVAAGITGLDVVTAAVRALVRQATGATAINAATAATTGTSALPRTFTVTVGVAAAADFTVEVDP